MHSIRPRRTQDDEFFDGGNDLCQKSSSDMILFYHWMETVDHEDENDDHDDDDDDNEQVKRKEDASRLYDCCVPHCQETFDSIAAQEEHYEKNHMHQCRECKCIFSNEYLLDLVSGSLFRSDMDFYE